MERNDNNQVYKNDELMEWGGWLSEFLWSCAGVNKKILRQCPGDYAKYAGIGGTILFTALMAMLSGGYALFFVFKNVYVSIAFGIFWGLLIFNLDRFIVNTMYSDGKHTISWGELKSGLPRIIMAIFLGIVISTPLELKIFESEITVQIQEDIKNKKEAYVANDKHKIDSLTQVRKEIYDRPLELPHAIALEGQAKDIQAQITEKQATLSQLRNDIASLKNQRSQVNNNPQRYQSLTNAINAKVIQLNKLNLEVSQLQGQLGALLPAYDEEIQKGKADKDELVKVIDNQIDYYKERIKNAGTYDILIDQEYGGFEARMKAFHNLRNKTTTTDIAAWFIMLLFVIIETAPTFFKMMMEDGPYDDLLRAEKHRVKVLSQKQMSDINDDINTAVQISTENNKTRFESEVRANKKVMEQIAKSQADLLQVAIESWRAEELAKIKANPSAYIKSNSSES